MSQNTISQISQLLNQSRIKKGEVAHLFSLIRVLMDQKQIKDKYPQLSFYADWSVHSNLDRSVECLSILESLTDLFIRATTKGFIDDEIHQAIGAIISISAMRAQLLELLSDVGINSPAITEDANWRGIFSLFAQTLIERPILWPSKPNLKAKEIYERCCAKTRNSDFLVRKFEFRKINDQLHWCVEAKTDFVDIVGLVLI
jgi:hypothetical protein